MTAGANAAGRERHQQRLDAERRESRPRPHQLIRRISLASCAPRRSGDKEGAFEMHAKAARCGPAVDRLLHRRRRPWRVILRRVRDQGRQQRRGADSVACASQIVRTPSAGRRVVEQHAAAAVDLRVDEARRQHAARPGAATGISAGTTASAHHVERCARRRPSTAWLRRCRLAAVEDLPRLRVANRVITRFP